MVRKARLQIYLFGGFQATLDGEPLRAFDSDKTRALLTYLAVETGEPHRREQLAGLLWPEMPERRARANLSQALYKLRALMGDPKAEIPFLAVSQTDLQFNAASDHWLDCSTFSQLCAVVEAHEHSGLESCEPCLEKLQEGVSLYRGDFLAGFCVPGVQAFQEWCSLTRETYHRQVLSALKKLAGAYECRGQIGQAQACAHRLVELDPYAEATRRQLMRLLQADGQQAAALAQYESHRRTLMDELGVEPSPETTELYEQIRAAQAAGPVASQKKRHNLPETLTAFIGREEEMASLGGMFRDPDCRLITILGPGGIGKTRLVIACAQRQLELNPGDGDPYAFPDGVCFVPLESIEDPDQIMREIAQALNLSVQQAGMIEQERSTIDQQLFDFLRRKRMLLVLDNFEQLLAGVPTIVKMLQATPKVRILVTSRERLRLQGEQVFPIGGLTYPWLETMEDPCSYSAIQLFVNSARHQQPSFEVNQENLSDLVQICILLGGMPLGLELAASWVGLLPMREIAAEIQRNIGFLESDWVDLPERHHSLLAVCDTTWKLMPPSEQEVFARLSVFRGGFTLEAAREVAQASLRDLRVLVSKSILDYDQAQGRYQIHPYLRQYAAEKLKANPKNESDTHDCHSTYYCDRAYQYFHVHMEKESGIALEFIDPDFRNVQTGWDWAIQQGSIEDIDHAIDGICFYFDSNLRNKEGLEICQSVINMLKQRGVSFSSEVGVSGERTPSLHLYAKALGWQGYFSFFFDHMKAAKSLEQSMSIIDTIKVIDTSNLKGFILFFRGGLALVQNDFLEAKHYFQKSLSLGREIYNQWIETYSLLNLGIVARNMGEFQEARIWYEQCLSRCRAQNFHWGEVQSLRGLGLVSQSLKAYDEAKHFFEQSVELSRLSKNQLAAIFVLGDLGRLALFLGCLEEAIERFTEGIALSKALDMPQRAYSLHISLGIAQYLSGDLNRAESNIEEARCHSQQISISNQIFPTIHYAKHLLLSGSYDQASDQIQKAKTLAQDLVLNKSLSGQLAWVTGWVALVDGNYPEACYQFKQSIENYYLAFEHNGVAHSQAGLARALVGEGNWGESHQLLTKALFTAIEIQGYIPMVFTLPMALPILVEEDPDLATYVYQQVQHDPFLAKAQFFHDLVYQHLPNEITCGPEVEVSGGPERREALWATAKLILEKWASDG